MLMSLRQACIIEHGTAVSSSAPNPSIHPSFITVCPALELSGVNPSSLWGDRLDKRPHSSLQTVKKSHADAGRTSKPHTERHRDWESNPATLSLVPHAQQISAFNQAATWKSLIPSYRQNWIPSCRFNHGRVWSYNSGLNRWGLKWVSTPAVIFLWNNYTIATLFGNELGTALHGETFLFFSRR